MSKAKKYSINITAIIVAVIIALGAVGVVIVGTISSWFKNADIRTWGGLGKKPTAAVLAIASDGAELKDGSVCSLANGITYLFTTRSEVTDEGIKETEYIPDGEITITAELDNAFLQGKFDWTSTFKDGAPAAEYVSVTPIIDGSNTAKLKFLKSFSEQITVAATLRGSENSDTCTVDCLQDVQYETSSANIGGNDFGDGLDFSITYAHNAGTVKSDVFRLNYLEIELNDTFITAFENYLKFDVTVKPCHLDTAEWTANTFEYALPNGGGTATGINFENGLLLEQSNFITDFDDFDQAHKEAIFFAWYQAYKANPYNVTMSFSIDYVYSGYTVSNYEETDLANGLYISGEADSYNIAPSVTLNKNYVV